MEIINKETILWKIRCFIMNTNDRINLPEKQIDPIDDYLECVTFCSVSNRAEENDCQTICMERHLKTSYF